MSRQLRDEIAPDAYDYGKIRWATNHGLNKLSHHGKDLPKLKKNPYSSHSYLKFADDFGEEGCVDCPKGYVHPLDKPADPLRPGHHTTPAAEKIDPTLENADLVRHYNPWVQWNPEPAKEEKAVDHRHHPLDYPTLNNIAEHNHDTEQDHDHDLHIKPRADPLPEYPSLGRYFQEGNTDVDKFFNTEIHHKYLPSRPLQKEVGKGIDWANWARNIR